MKKLLQTKHGSRAFLDRCQDFCTCTCTYTCTCYLSLKKKEFPGYVALFFRPLLNCIGLMTAICRKIGRLRNMPKLKFRKWTFLGSTPSNGLWSKWRLMRNKINIFFQANSHQSNYVTKSYCVLIFTCEDKDLGFIFAMFWKQQAKLKSNKDLHCPTQIQQLEGSHRSVICISNLTLIVAFFVILFLIYNKLSNTRCDCFPSQPPCTQSLNEVK